MVGGDVLSAIASVCPVLFPRRLTICGFLLALRNITPYYVLLYMGLPQMHVVLEKEIRKIRVLSHLQSLLLPLLVNSQRGQHTCLVCLCVFPVGMITVLSVLF